MITTNKFPVPGGFLITAYYREANRPKIYTRLTSDETRAENLLKQIKKDVLREKVSKYINHRQNILENHGGLRTESKFKAIETLKNSLAFVEKHSLEANCRIVVSYEDLFKSILPGQSSIFHKTQTEALTEILSFCQLELKVKL